MHWPRDDDVTAPTGRVGFNSNIDSFDAVSLSRTAACKFTTYIFTRV